MKDFKSYTVLSCEHANNEIPLAFKGKVKISKNILTSHRGLDIGANYLSDIMQELLKINVSKFEICRLLIEGNRPLEDKGLFSNYTKNLSENEKNELINKFHKPHWQKVKKRCVKALNKSGFCLHIGIHSFTPIYKGVKRELDIGLLFDPKNKLEKNLCLKLQKELTSLGFIVKLNTPYKGIEPGMTQSFRTEFENYAGIELEVNQKIFRKKSYPEKSLLIAQTFKKCLSNYP